MAIKLLHRIFEIFYTQSFKFYYTIQRFFFQFVMKITRVERNIHRSIQISNNCSWVLLLPNDIEIHLLLCAPPTVGMYVLHCRQYHV